MEHDILERTFDGSIKPQDVKLSAIESITENFSNERVIGEGGFATVYKGVLRNGEVVAVKRIRNSHTIDDKLFRREVNSLLKVHHKNIVRFLGFCSHTDHKAIKFEGSSEFIYAEVRERILCFEYINNGSLEKYIADELRGLQWDTRYLIIKGICQGLLYLHTKMHIIHMDLKPANILIDDNMVAKITDFGLSRLVENSQTKSSDRFLSPGYSAPEYIESGSMTVKYDVYSLGIIIIELVTGHRSLPDSNNVLRRWRHRCHKSGKETPFRYQQIAKLIEIGLQCQEKDPCKRPFISDIISDISKLESIDRKINNVNESMVGQISPYPEDDMLGIEPLELHFPIELDKQISCSLELTNDTKVFCAFNIQTTSPLPYCIQPNQDIVAPGSKYCVNITLQPLDHALEDMQYNGNFIVRSTKVNESLISEDITEDIFDKENGKLVDEVNLTITYKAEVPPVDVSLGSLMISDTRNLQGPTKSNVFPAEPDSKISASNSDEVIQLDPPELCFPLVPDEKVLSSIKVINLTEFYVSFMLGFHEENTAYYHHPIPTSTLSPRSTQWLTITRKVKEDAVKDMQFNDKLFLCYAIVAEDIKPCDLDVEDYTEWKNLPIVLTNTRSIELIQFEPPELCFPLLPNQRALSSAKMVNITDQYIGFRICGTKSNSAGYDANPLEGILPPLSTQVLLVTRVAQENELEDTQCKHKLLVWNGIVTEDVKASDVIAKMSEPKCTELPIVLTKTSLSISDELIQFHPPEHHFPFLPNKKVLSTIKIVNLTDYNVGFNTYTRPTSAAWYYTEPPTGILQPRSTQKLMVTREEKEDALKDKQFNDKYFVWTSVVSEGVKYSDLSDYIADQESKEFPIVLDKISSITSDELIQLDPAELCMPQWPNKHIKFIVNVVNTTDFYVAFNVYTISRNATRYKKSTVEGILPPRYTERCILHWTIDDGEPVEDYFVWNRVVTEGVESGDIVGYMVEEESKKLPFIINKVSPCPSNGLIHFDPPELSLPFVPNKPFVFSVNIVNNTDYRVGFNIYHPESNVGAYFIEFEPEGGVMPPRSTQRFVVQWLPEGYFITRAGVVMAPHNKEREDMHCQDKFLLWTCLVSEGAEASDIIDDYSEYEGSQELPIVHKKTSLCTSDELIKFDPPQLSFPFFPNKRVSMFCFFKIVNATDHCVGFNIWVRNDNCANYMMVPRTGILPPQSTQAIKVQRTPKKEEQEDMQCKDKITVWTGIVTQKGIEVSDLLKFTSYEDKVLPVVLIKPGGSSSS